MSGGDWLGLAGREVLVTGLKNRKSVAYHVASQLREAGARPVFVVRTEERLESAAKLIGDDPAYVCDVKDDEAVARLGAVVAEKHPGLAGFVHSIAFANYSDGWKPFHETRKDDFLEAAGVSAFSLVALARALRPALAPDASVVAISISSTTMAAENYGYMAPIKAALDSAMRALGELGGGGGEVDAAGAAGGGTISLPRSARSQWWGTCSVRRRPRRAALWCGCPASSA